MLIIRFLSINLLISILINKDRRARDVHSYHRLMLKNQTIFTKLVFEELADLQLSVGQPKVLEYLSEHDGSIQKEIAEACQIEPATVTSLLIRMEKSGLIYRKNKHGDKRYICVFLTDYGKSVALSVLNAFKEVEALALKNFSERERESFLSFLFRVNENLSVERGQQCE